MSRDRKGSSAGTTAALLVVGGLVLSHMHPAAAAPAPRHAFTAASNESVAANIRLGRAMAARYGWTGAQWTCLDVLWTGESGWSQYADTRRSGLDPANATVFAYGIPQSRPDWKMPRAARPASQGGHSDPQAQIGWGLRYIKGRYGDPCAALAFKRANGNQGY